MLEAKPEHLIGDKAYDSDALDATLKKVGVGMISPPVGPQAQNARWAAFATLLAKVDGGALFRMVELEESLSDPLGVLLRTFSVSLSLRPSPSFYSVVDKLDNIF